MGIISVASLAHCAIVKITAVRIPQNVSGDGRVSFDCQYETSQQNMYISKMAAYIGIRKIDGQDSNEIEIIEYAGSHDPDYHDKLYSVVVSHDLECVSVPARGSCEHHVSVTDM